MQTLSVQLFNPLGIPCESANNRQGIYIQCLKTLETSNIQTLSVQLCNPLGIPMKNDKDPKQQEMYEQTSGTHVSDGVRG